MVSGLGGDAADAIARIARPIHGERDLDRMLDQVGAARFVLIGEASLGTHDLNDLRGTLTRKLIAERGFSALAIAGGWSEALRVDRYVRGLGDDDSAATALSGFDRFPTWMWRNTDVSAFAEWLRTWNSQQPVARRAGFYGLDLYSLYVAIRTLLSFLDDADPAAAAGARDHFAGFDHVASGRDASSAPLELSRSHEEEVVAELVEMQRRHLARSGRTPGGTGWFHMMQAAHVIKDADAYYRAMLRGRVVWNLRDSRMADALGMLSEHLGAPGRPGRVVVWAHNRNVGDARATAMGDAGEIALGQVMRQRYPGDVVLIGMTVHTGTVRCARGWDEPALAEQVPPSLAGSWEQLLQASGFPRFYVGAPALRRVLGDRVERLQRAIGAVYRAESERHRHYHRSRLAEQFDVVMHIEASRAATPLDDEFAAPASVGAVVG
jgi:erythromycin esterase-like protein